LCYSHSPLLVIIENSKNINANKSRNSKHRGFCTEIAFCNLTKGKTYQGGGEVKKIMLGLVMPYRQMQQLEEEDYKNEKISREQYEERKKQIEAGSIIY
jgi:hypothetical protein